MAANKFATMLHRNTNKLTLILIYAVLEWILILLLLLNSLFSYLIIRFAAYFGLKTPCPWCSRVDHIFEPKKNKNSHRDLLCEAHATEISKLGYCSMHRKLAESQDMCEDCSSSRPEFRGGSKDYAFFPLVKQIGMIQREGEKVVENGEASFVCSCCGVCLDRKFYSPYIVIKPSWDVLDYAQKGNLITGADNDDDPIEECDNSDRSRSDCGADRCETEHGTESKIEGQMLFEVGGGFGVREMEAEEDCSVFLPNSGLEESQGDDEDDRIDVVLEAEKKPFMEDEPTMIQICSNKDASAEIPPQHLEFFVGHDGYGLIPIELIADENQSNSGIGEEDGENCYADEANLGSELHVQEGVESATKKRRSLEKSESKGGPEFAVLESMEIEENENSFIFHAKECKLVKRVHDQVAMARTIRAQSIDVDDDQGTATADGKERESDSDDSPVSEEVCQMPISEAEAEVSIGGEIPDLDHTVEIQDQEILPSCQFINEDLSTCSANNLHSDDDHGCRQTEEETVHCKTVAVEMVGEQEMSSHLSLSAELNDIEEERAPDTPTSVDSLHQLHKKLLLLERRESGAEDSLDGSVMSELEGCEGVLTVERLKSALKLERKALRALYAELEEERSASAVAANQTMAMINRLQEEKATMQMEALQYQRMMEEQTEYDQEALQLLNELMVKREKEKQELEKELEIYRKKVVDYEGKMRMLRKSKDASGRSMASSASCSNAEDSDGLSIDLNQDGKEEDSLDGHQESGHHNTPVDTVLNLEESLANFEEERLSILEQLKVLEEKLFTLADEEDPNSVDMKSIDHFDRDNGKHLDENSHSDGEENGVASGFAMEMNGKHHQEKFIMGAKAKRLLPLFDAISLDNENGVCNGHENGLGFNVLQTSAKAEIKHEDKRFAVEEEVDHLYERLQALEADREFLKHCIGSLKKGDKGIDLLQEILLHLRDLRDVELRVRNLGDANGAVD